MEYEFQAVFVAKNLFLPKNVLDLHNKTKGY